MMRSDPTLLKRHSRQSIILETVCSQADFIDVVRDFNKFRARAGGHFGSQSLLFHEKFTPLDAWRLTNC